ncbi:type VII secretion integral membrane protein EccD [Actinoallomurus sp. CA-150999]|uniref:type VII secretion integral membrane protein EccD n=1 Tax=Actinoallomurus sp. CA-150999 TaxID=3239887 RepID=UPI003D8BB737
MADERCRITVVGERGRVDLAVPARAPIAAYVPMLADMCGEPDSDAMPAAWSLAPAGGGPFQPGVSLESVGVLDGETLYLRDVVQGEFDGPVVADVEEQVAEVEDDGRTWNARARAHTTLGLGLLIVLAAAGALGFGADRTPLLTLLLFGVGVASAAVAWVAGLKIWPVPTVMRLGLAVAACPIFASAASALPLSSPRTSVIAAVVSASIGAFASYLAAPAITTMVLQAICAVGLVLAVPLALLRADLLEAAAVVAVALFLVLGALPRAAAQIAAVPPGPSEMEDVERAVRRVQSLLIFLNALCCVVIAACLTVLAGSRDWYALGLALCLGLALLCRANSARLRAVVAAVLLSGATGLVGLSIQAPAAVLDLLGSAGPSGWAGPLAALWSGVIVVWCGLVMCFRSSLQQADFDERWRWPGSVATFLGVISVPLAVGVFGVFDALMRAGGRM